MIKVIEAADRVHEIERRGRSRSATRETRERSGKRGAGCVAGDQSLNDISKRRKKKRRGESNAHIDKPFILLAAMPRPIRWTTVERSMTIGLNVGRAPSRNGRVGMTELDALIRHKNCRPPPAVPCRSDSPIQFQNAELLLVTAAGSAMCGCGMNPIAALILLHCTCSTKHFRFACRLFLSARHHQCCTQCT